MTEQQQREAMFWLANLYSRVRYLEDGTIMGLVNMYTNQWRIYYDMDMGGTGQAYCYHGRDSAVAAFEGFDPATMSEPTGWVKHVQTNRCRPGGDPAKETIGWP